MKHYLKVNWSDVLHTLSGNRAVETMIADHPLPSGLYWVIMERQDGFWFVGQKRIKLRPNGKGQVSVMGKYSVGCELVRGRNSEGSIVEFIQAVVWAANIDPAFE